MSSKALALDNFFSGIFPKSKGLSVSKKSDVSNFRFLLAASLITLNAVFLFSYIYGVNTSAATGYEIQSLQTNVANLNLANKQINLQVAEAGSMVGIQNDFLSAGFVPAGTPVFLQNPEVSMNQK
jgi:cell division protein FtsL